MSAGPTDLAAQCLAVAESYQAIAAEWMDLDPLRAETAARNAMFWNEKARAHLGAAQTRH